MKLFNKLPSILILLLFLPQLSDANQDKKETPPNFIVILSDDQSYVGTSFLSNPEDPRTKSDYYQTPNMDRLADRNIGGFLIIQKKRTYYYL